MGWTWRACCVVVVLLHKLCWMRMMQETEQMPLAVQGGYRTRHVLSETAVVA
jgi:hypothetical protein